MKNRLFLFATLLLGGRAAMADDATLISVAQENNAPTSASHGKVFRWKISKAASQRLPHWSLGDGPVPLNLNDAALAAKRWIAAQPWANRFERFNSIDFTPSELSGKRENQLWHYAFNVTLTDDDGSLPHLVPVLLDGTVVEPTVEPDKPSD